MSSEESKKAILQARAQQLSQIRAQPSDNTDTFEVVEFKIASEVYAMESRFIREVYSIRDYTELPCVPPFVVGLINVRRKVIALIDICYFFDLPKTEPLIGKKALILVDGDMQFGLAIESVIAVSLVPKTALQTTLPTLTAVRQEFLKGVTANGLIVLDPQKLFESKRLIVNEVA